MITRVWGLINMNQALPFYQKGERWFFDIPDKDGTYICEFWAQDDYENIGYNRAILYIEGGRVKCMRVMSSRYKSLLMAPRYAVGASADRFTVEAEIGGYTAVAMPRRWLSDMKLMTCPADMKEIA